MYAMVLTQLDIAFAVSRVAKFKSNPWQSHWTAVKSIFCYLSGTLHMNISYYGSQQDFTLRGYCDVDYAENHDDRKSYTLNIFLLANHAIAWVANARVALLIPPQRHSLLQRSHEGREHHHVPSTKARSRVKVARHTS